MQARMHSGLDMNMVQTAVLKKLDEKGNDFQDTYEKIEEFSKTFEKGHFYVHNPYLVYIATELYLSKQTILPFMLGPGQGKTFLGLLLAKMHT